ncbi:MAG: hypothetical protein FWG31_09845 [Oscillospiraceae bacterium]|nr:hypothetical protein [Oscillospiraceae bacterium]
MFKVSMRLLVMILVLCCLASCARSLPEEDYEIFAEVYHGVTDPDPEIRELTADSDNTIRLKYQIENVGNKMEYGLFALMNGILQPLTIEGVETGMAKMMLDPDMELPTEDSWYSQRISQTLGWRIIQSNNQSSSALSEFLSLDDLLMYSAAKEFKGSYKLSCNLSFTVTSLKETFNSNFNLCSQFSSENE